MITGKRGKPTVSERLMERLIIARNPEEIAPRVFSNLDSRFGIAESMDIARKCQDISNMVSKAVESITLKASGETSPEDRVANAYPWLLETSPVNTVKEAEKAATVNDQVVSALMSHLVNHLVIGEGLRRLAARARLEVVDDLDNIPKEFRDFAVSLQLEGVTGKPLSRLSRERLCQIADFIRGITGSALDSLPVNSGDASKRDDSLDTGVILESESGDMESDRPKIPELGRGLDIASISTLPVNSRIGADDSKLVDLSDSEMAVLPVVDPVVAPVVAPGIAPGMLVAMADDMALSSLRPDGSDPVLIESLDMPIGQDIGQGIGQGIGQDISQDISPVAEVVISPSSDVMARIAATLGYEVVERVASTDTDVEALGSPSPPAGIELRNLGSDIRHKVDLRMMWEAGDVGGIQSILMGRWAKDDERFAGDEELARRWSWELVAMAGLSDPPLYPAGWWSGVVVRSPDPSRTRVRELRSIAE